MSKTDKANDECYFVYCHYNKVNGKVYVGITKNVKKRWGSNGCCYKKLKNKGCFADAIQKYGWDNFEHIILESNVTQKQAKFLEQLYIIELDSLVPNGYNLTKGGDGLVGYKASERTRKLLSDSHKGKASPKKGISLSDETKLKISFSNSGKVRSDEFKENARKRMLGKHLSEEARVKLSNSKRGIKFSDTHKRNLSKAMKKYSQTHPDFMRQKSCKPVIQYDLSGNFICEYESITDACLWNDYTNQYIGEVCRGKRKQYKGYLWRLKNE